MAVEFMQLEATLKQQDLMESRLILLKYQFMF